MRSATAVLQGVNGLGATGAAVVDVVT